MKRISEFGCHILVPADEEYPRLLREIYDPPIVLYVRGRLTEKDRNAVAMVGSRMTTHYGIETARKLGSIRNGTHLDDHNPKIQLMYGKRISVASGARVLVDLDGETPGTLPALFEIQPGAIEFIAPV